MRRAFGSIPSTLTNCVGEQRQTGVPLSIKKALMPLAPLEGSGRPCPASQILGAEGSGLFQALSHIGRVRLGKVGARSVGMARRILQMTIEHAKQRKQFGKSLGEFQFVQGGLADMATEIYAARLMILNTAWEIDQGLDPREKVSMVKYFASEMLGRIADKSVQIFGDMGYCRDLPIEQLYRDARVYRIFDGASDIHRIVIARNLLKTGQEVL